jgi:hypothetical protein
MLTHVDDDGEQRILPADFGIARNVDDLVEVLNTVRANALPTGGVA